MEWDRIFEDPALFMEKRKGKSRSHAKIILILGLA
jgi:hypothetical protein